MALPHELPVTQPDITDPDHLRFIWARYLRQEVVHHGKRKRRTFTISLEGAAEIAELLHPEVS